MSERIAIVGGGAAGFFAAITCAEANPAHEVSIYEKGPEFLTKVRISGGGRCNVTHACFEPRAMSESYPRGERALISPLNRFSAADTVAWFERRGVRLKTEEDGRMFPVTDSSGTVIDCLLYEAKAAGVRLFTRKGVNSIQRKDGGFEMEFDGGNMATCDKVLLATGGTCSAIGGQIAESLGHELAAPVPSLFSFHVIEAWLRSLPGVSLREVEASVPSVRLRERGPVLITHQGMSGPVILRLSAWGARALHELDYQFTLRVNWLPGATQESVRDRLLQLRQASPNKLIVNSALDALPNRLWEKLTELAGINSAVRATTLSREQANALAALLVRTELTIHGKSLNKDEFVTCGGVQLIEVDFKTMQSRITPGLYFAGELLDIDGITGGFNFQAAWTTGWIAGNALAR